MNRIPLITEISSVDNFMEILKRNPGIIIIKFGAQWCGPCKKVEELVHKCIDFMPNTCQSIIIDIDTNFEIYAQLKKLKMVTGIPSILCYDKNNISIYPNDSVMGSDETQIKLFFQRCYDKLIN